MQMEENGRVAIAESARSRPGVRRFAVAPSGKASNRPQRFRFRRDLGRPDCLDLTNPFFTSRRPNPQASPPSLQPQHRPARPPSVDTPPASSVPPQGPGPCRAHIHSLVGPSVPRPRRVDRAGAGAGAGCRARRRKLEGGGDGKECQCKIHLVQSQPTKAEGKQWGLAVSYLVRPSSAVVSARSRVDKCRAVEGRIPCLPDVAKVQP